MSPHQDDDDDYAIYTRIFTSEEFLIVRWVSALRVLVILSHFNEGNASARGKRSMTPIVSIDIGQVGNKKR